MSTGVNLGVAVGVGGSVGSGVHVTTGVQVGAKVAVAVGKTSRVTRVGVVSDLGAKGVREGAIKTRRQQTTTTAVSPRAATVSRFHIVSRSALVSTSDIRLTNRHPIIQSRMKNHMERARIPSSYGV